ncbi:MAG TPA: hypothetical protein VNA16_03835, partial [Abditibacteriaceae bacterium]|nr:hypothetical protein [Abditibacteriaceae bacterium]
MTYTDKDAKASKPAAPFKINMAVGTFDSDDKSVMNSELHGDGGATPARRRLFFVSFIILFFELACIRWFASSVIFLTFFTNIVLMACFLGMSIGCLSATGRRDFTRWVLPLMLVAVALACLSLGLYQSHSRLSVSVGGQAAPQQIFFGTEYRANDPAQIVIPIEAIAGVFFVLIALIFVGLGQIMGRAFNAIPNRVAAYTADIAGSFAGIVAFGIVSYCRMPPLVWFAISTAIFLCLKYADEQALVAHDDAAAPRRNLVRTAIQAAAAIGVLFLVSAPDLASPAAMQTFWSPYYKINYLPAPDYVISTNNIGHQEMRSIARNGPAYALPHLLNRDAGQKPFADVLIIGAGSGNDVQAARYFNVSRIDAVEIDPVIQSLGRQYHPDGPYADPRVTVYLDDGRSFVKKTHKKYDLVIYALVDSLVLHSGYSSLRLESFLFTRQAFEDIKAKLKPGGMFAMYNFYRQGWVVTRLTKIAHEVFGAPPLVFSLPYRERIRPEAAQLGHYTFILCGGTRQIQDAFARDKFFWLNTVPVYNRNLNAFGVRPPESPVQPRLPTTPAQALPGAPRLEAAPSWMGVGPARVDTSTTTLLPTDDWPFLYLRERAIPGLNVRGMALIALLSLALLFLIVPARPGSFGLRVSSSTLHS